MKTRFRLLILCLVLVAGTLSSMPVLAEPRLSPPHQEGMSTPTPGVLTPAGIIEAVNFLRLQHGLNPLAVHNVLMDVAASQANALAASGGAVGHQRPCGMTLGQELLLKGFPLWGDLSMDGYRSENWGTAMTADETISMWLGDDLHANTMLSPNRSDIGAAVAVSDQIYVVLETALRTNSGQHQGIAYDILTGIPMTQAACMGWATQNAGLGPLAQYSVPVAPSTARPDGDVIHEVMYGQTLWSIAIQYGTTIEQIKRLNNLTDNTVVQGWKLLVQKDATQPAPVTVLPPATKAATYQIPTPTLGNTMTPTQDTSATSFQMDIFVRQNSTVVVALLISFSVLVAGIVGFGRKKES
jgi:LysM repeat protein